MNILYYDCFAGISGDMNLGALLDAGVDPDYFLREIAKLNLNGEFEVTIAKALKKGISGIKVDVRLTGDQRGSHQGSEHAEHGHEHEHNHGHEHEHAHGHEHVHGHEHNHAHGHEHEHEHNHAHEQTHIQEHNHHHEQGHTHKHDHSHDHHHGHHHRNVEDIERIIGASSLPDRVKELSMKIFMQVALAEAKVHGKPLEEVHFHEVGAVDSIVDIVGASICLDYLKVDKILASPVQVGGGFVRCEHGLIPVPAPATVEILKGIPVKAGLVPFETTTPTGAAILAAVVDEFTDKPDFVMEAVGYGLGNRDLEIPNVLRVYLGRMEDKKESAAAGPILLETNIDDMNPELYSYVEEQLFARGASDVFKTPIIMKKGRPAVKLSVLVGSKREKEVLEVIFKETTSLGVRKFPVGKAMLERSFVKHNTRYGEVTIKNSYYEGKLVKYKPEYEDCKRLALANGVPISKIYREIYTGYEVNLDESQPEI
ncbi:nickel pincer cofactor biosynthesis protein LarC [Paenibacillus rhizophilus]|uniref:Pyridinium-3,5-bisthiocarboxylic acid mononucleotide nickel insertion protein n=1 Tax=Paenibacillus rhizophilus TaxID=1850366 RepID=A0A3N9PD36_9BACL|nr:nickel pincer cofactor biosynthesis protein LarC [Paenibacillus rhizophilus]RQW13420.1 nickel pincer cofactor biosynthesis protein LarC [Paenibacillus rhizophilus]